jgi:hypothetical protein
MRGVFASSDYGFFEEWFDYLLTDDSSNLNIEKQIKNGLPNRKKSLF